MSHKTTIKDLAQAADVSVTTVSHILNGKGERFNPETISRVRKLKQELNYVPNFNARNLILHDAKSIGVVVPNIGNPFFSSFVDGIQQACRDNGYLPFNFSGDNNIKLESYYMQQLSNRGIQGLIIASSSITMKIINDIVKLNNIPYILMDQSPLSEGDQVRTTDEVGGHMVAKHLIQNGHSRMAIIRPKKATKNIELRIAGFIDECKTYGIDYENDVQVIDAPLSKEGGLSAAQEVIRIGATATFAINDEMAMGLYRGLQDLGLKIPQDMSVIGYDGTDLGLFMNPKLTTIQQPIREMGKKATELLINRIQNPDIKQQVAEMSVKLVNRFSVSSPRSESIV